MAPAASRTEEPSTTILAPVYGNLVADPACRCASAGLASLDYYIVLIDTLLPTRKAEILDYFRSRATEAMSETRRQYGEGQPKERARDLNRAINAAYMQVLASLKSVADAEAWPKATLLSSALLLHYCSSVVMIESRNDVWRYDYMSFSRRMGELWQPFCKICFDFPITKLRPVLPPLFADVKKSLRLEVTSYIRELDLTTRQSNELLGYYEKVWKFVDSGEINLALDLHFSSSGRDYAVDFKSAFGSNEKGNTNRLLLVAAVYRAAYPETKCLLWVRAAEDQNNAYFRTLQRSGLWEAYCGEETYRQIEMHSGFDILSWIRSNVAWLDDLNSATTQHLSDLGIERYAQW